MQKTYTYYRVHRRPRRKASYRKVRRVLSEKKLVSKSEGEEQEDADHEMSQPVMFHRRASPDAITDESEVKEIEDTRTASEAAFERRNYLATPWGNVDRRGIRLGVQFSLTLILLGFCFWQVATMPSNQTGAVWGMIGTFIGFWFDSPHSSGDNKK